jgi:hypothetical protein
MSLDPKDAEALLRWRLALGDGAEDVDPSLSLDALSQGAPGLGLSAGEAAELDRALDFVYGDRRGNLAATRPYIPHWLGALRKFFRHEVIALVQQDAIAKKGLTQLLFEPETLPFLEKNVALAATLVAAKDLVPEQAKDLARQIVGEIVEQVRKKLETSVRTSLLGAVRRGTHSPLKIAKNLDYKRTIERNLRGWDSKRQRLVPEHLYFWSNQRRRHEWDVALVIDQSGSMAESVVYASVMGAIFASLDVLRTKLLVFDTEVVDLTPVLSDPVELLFSTQLGGGTDINRAVAYAAEHFIERPERTIFLLITDLYEGGDGEALLARLRALVESKVKVVCILALSDGGQPSYDHARAQQLMALGIPCFGATPDLLASVMERIMKGQDLGGLVPPRP